MTDEYIRKEDVLKEKRTGTFPNGICMEAKACVTVEYIKSILPADVVPVVRCKDCESYIGIRRWCGLNKVRMFEEDFCSYGERREE